MKKIKLVLRIVCIIVLLEIFLPIAIIAWAIDHSLIDRLKALKKGLEEYEQRNR